MAALALSGDWTAEFLSGPDAAATPGLAALGDAADADWTREFIAEAAGTLCLLCGSSLLSCVSFWEHMVCNSTFWRYHQSSYVITFYWCGAEYALCLNSFKLPVMFLCSRSWTLGRGVSGAVRGKVMAGRPGRQGKWMVRAWGYGWRTLNIWKWKIGCMKDCFRHLAVIMEQRNTNESRFECKSKPW